MFHPSCLLTFRYTWHALRNLVAAGSSRKLSVASSLLIANITQAWTPPPQTLTAQPRCLQCCCHCAPTLARLLLPLGFRCMVSSCAQPHLCWRSLRSSLARRVVVFPVPERPWTQQLQACCSTTSSCSFISMGRSSWEGGRGGEQVKLQGFLRACALPPLHS